MSQKPITITGGGLGGLALGRCLKQRGISSIIFERVSASPRHHYAMTLHPSAYRPLLKVLGIDETVFRNRVSVKKGAERAPAQLQGDAGANLGSSFRAHRATLEALLREGLDVQFEHSLESAKIENGHINLSFENGRKITCELLVVADGVHSAARKSLVPEAKLKVLPFVVFNGKRKIKRSHYDKLYATVLDETTTAEILIGDRLLQISVNEYNDKDDIVNLSYTYSRPANPAGDALHRPSRPLKGTSEIPSDFYEELAALRVEQPFADMFDPTKIREKRVLHWLMRTSHVEKRELEGLAEKGVVMIGDAVHAEPILGGWGGNNALRDAVALADLIGEQGRRDLTEFVDRKAREWEFGVGESEARIERMHEDEERGARQLGENRSAL